MTHIERATCRAAASVVMVAALVGLAGACDHLPGVVSPDADPCALEITKLEGRRAAEIAAACHGQLFDECPAVESINAKYDPLIAQQVECRGVR